MMRMERTEVKRKGLRGASATWATVRWAAPWLLPLGLLSCSRALAAEKHEAPAGWIVAGSAPAAFEMTADAEVHHAGKESGHLRSLESPDGFGTLMQLFDAGSFRGKRVRLSAYVKASDVKGWAGLWMRVDGPEKDKSLAFDNMERRAIKGTVDWARVEVVLDVSEESTNVAFGILLEGQGQVWIDDVSLEVVDRSVATTDMIGARVAAKAPANLDFEQ